MSKQIRGYPLITILSEGGGTNIMLNKFNNPFFSKSTKLSVDELTYRLMDYVSILSLYAIA